MTDVHVRITLREGVKDYDMTDSLNEFFRSEGILPMIADDDDTGWSYLEGPEDQS